jgi:hypothetical protein
MTNEEAIRVLNVAKAECEWNAPLEYQEAFDVAIEALKAQPKHDQNTMSKQQDLETLGIKTGETCEDAISRQAAIDVVRRCSVKEVAPAYMLIDKAEVMTELMMLPSAQPDLGKYEYHYDHTDCIWYRPEARNRCPVTCAQYRDGWNDAMNYIFRDGKGYRPYRRGEQYEE